MCIIEISKDQGKTWLPYKDKVTERVKILTERSEARLELRFVRQKAKPDELFQITPVSSIRAAMMRAAKVA